MGPITWVKLILSIIALLFFFTVFLYGFIFFLSAGTIAKTVAEEIDKEKDKERAKIKRELYAEWKLKADQEKEDMRAALAKDYEKRLKALEKRSKK